MNMIPDTAVTNTDHTEHDQIDGDASPETALDAADGVADAVEAEGDDAVQPVRASRLPPRDLSDDEATDLLRLLEALLFTASDVVTLNDLLPFFPPQTPVEQLLERLETQYAERGINLVQRGNGWALRTAPDLGDRLQIRKSETKPMSRPVIETLAIIAYHQPVTKPEIEQIRGVSVGKNILETLLEQNLIKPGKRREVPGRPLTWMTSPHFLDAFGLTTLKDLPNLQEMKEQGLLTVAPPSFGLQTRLGLDDGDVDDSDETDETETDDADTDTLRDEDPEKDLSPDAGNGYDEANTQTDDAA